jgi:hypothetical protein
MSKRWYNTNFLTTKEIKTINNIIDQYEYEESTREQRIAAMHRQQELEQYISYSIVIAFIVLVMYVITKIGGLML